MCSRLAGDGSKSTFPFSIFSTFVASYNYFPNRKCISYDFIRKLKSSSYNKLKNAIMVKNLKKIIWILVVFLKEYHCFRLAYNFCKY